ncbi:unnamed protein product [Mytilus edulis]|uniref:Uncharacterized protein n=1 Tax=Mytilus edulis TaxID=6550 RepID=A0A8S3RYG7_MYTED|nr:unnamed protein product [Mytilus edulis]
MQLTNESLHTMHSFKIDVYNMALLPSGELLLSTMESNLKTISCSTSKVEPTKYSVNPLITLAVQYLHFYVIDNQDEKFNGRTVALDKSNGVRWIYSGHLDVNKQQTFKLDDLVATKSDNILVTDLKHHMFHILNISGHCILYLNTKDQLGIEFPYSLDIDNTGTLYIGCYKYLGEPDEAKIYTVQVSGFY